MDGGPARVLQGVGEAHIGGRVDQNPVPGGGEGLDGGADAAQHAVFIADVLFLQACDAVAAALPGEDGVIVVLRQGEVAEVGEGQAVAHGLQDRRGGGKGHVRDPHGDRIKARIDRDAREGNLVGGQAVASRAVQDGGKIVFHISLLVRCSFGCPHSSRLTGICHGILFLATDAVIRYTGSTIL